MTMGMPTQGRRRRQRGQRHLSSMYGRAWMLLLLLVLTRVGASWTSWLSTATSSSSASSSSTAQDNGLLDEFVSPILHRQVSTRVVAHSWGPTTLHSILCEAYVYHQQVDREQQQQPPPDRGISISDGAAAAETFLRNLVQALQRLLHHHQNNETAILLTTRQQAVALAWQASPLPVLPRRLLPVALHWRAHSPTCELQRTLLAPPLLPRPVQDNNNAIMVLYPTGRVLTSTEWPLFDWDAWRAEVATDAAQDNVTEWMDQIVLPDETVLRHGDNDAAHNHLDALIVVYANLGSAAFVQAFQVLENNRMLLPKVGIVVRHLGQVMNKNETCDAGSGGGGTAATATPTQLQGYGVRLDIRNVEYKVFDDRQQQHAENDDHDSSNKNGLLNVSNVPHMPAQSSLAGVNVRHFPDLHGNVTKALWQTHETQARQAHMVPPTWQRRQLPVQATTAIINSRDPLVTLQHIAQDLPSWASTLVHVPIDEAVEAWAHAVEQERRLVPGRLYLNGRAISLERPSMNVFETLALLRQEMSTATAWTQMLRPYLSHEALRAVHNAWRQGASFFDVAQEGDDDDEGADSDNDDDDDDGGMAGSSYRVDVGRGWKGAILYLNDIEKDAQYAQWPRSMQQMLVSMQYGMPPMVRRNLFTILAVVNPLQQTAANGGIALQFGTQLMQSSFPARVGVLLIDHKDVQTCADWLAAAATDSTTAIPDDAPCPVSPLFAATPSQDELQKTPATVPAVYVLLNRFVTDYGHEPGALAAYVEYLMQSMREHQDTQGALSMADLAALHGNLLEGMQVASFHESQAEAIETLQSAVSNAEDDAVSYGRALRFAVEKALRPGMGFLNGRPLPMAMSENINKEISDLLRQEQAHIFQLVAKREITDDKPKSVYSKLLSGDKVFNKAHPLVMGADSDENAYLAMQHLFDARSLLLPVSHNSDEQIPSAAAFVLELVVDYSTTAGREEAVSFIDMMSAFNASDALRHFQAIDVAYRVLPANEAAASSPSCSLFAVASAIGPEQIARALKSDFKTAADIENFLRSHREMQDGTVVALSGNACASLPYGSVPTTIVANGRTYQPDDGKIASNDIALLVSIELERAKCVTSHVRTQRVSALDNIEAIGRATSFLSAEAKKQAFARRDPTGVSRKVKTDTDTGRNPLVVEWNRDGEAENSVEIVAVLDPVSYSAQRLAPLLRVLRDNLGLPLTLILAPATLIDGDAKIPITSYYRFVGDPLRFDAEAMFDNLPSTHVLTLRMDVPEPWDVQQSKAVQDTDNLQCDAQSGCSDQAYSPRPTIEVLPLYEQQHVSEVEFELKSLLVFGQCYEATGSPPNGLQLVISRQRDLFLETDPPAEVSVGMDGTVQSRATLEGTNRDVAARRHADTLVMKNVGYWQLRASPGVWELAIAGESKGAEMFDFVHGNVATAAGVLQMPKNATLAPRKRLVLQDFVNRGELLLMKRRPGYESASLFYDDSDLAHAGTGTAAKDDETIHVFSLATGHLYERFLKIMMLSVTKRTSTRVKFWLFENYLSPTFKESAQAMARQIGCEVAFVTYKWPEWLRGQTEKQRIIWGYKILFLDVLFPLDVKRIIYVDADQVVRGDLKELWDMDLQGRAYGYTPFCTSRQSTLGYQFWREGFWKTHLRGRPYHISALYVVDLERFRQQLVGDQLRAIYQQLSADPNSLANLDQDLPNYAQHQVPIFSLPQEWLWCESWCSDETKTTAKTIDLCNNPEHKEPKVSMAKRIISGSLFNESWVELDNEVERYYRDYLASIELGR